METGSYFRQLSGLEDVNELFNMDIDRTDLVGFPAIGRKFLLIKAKNGVEDHSKEENTMNELVKNIRSMASDIRESNTNDLAKQAGDLLDELADSVESGGIDKEVASAIFDNFDSAFDDADKLTEEEFEKWSANLKKELGSDTETATEEQIVESGETEVKAVEEAVEEVVEEVEKEDGDMVEEVEVIEEVEEVEEIAEEEADKEEEVVAKELSSQIKKAQKEIEKQREELKKANAEIKKLRDDKQKSEYIQKAESDLNHIGKSAEGIADIFMALRSAGVPDEVFDDVYGLLKSANEMIDKSGFFTEKGTEVEPEPEEDGDEKIMKEARALVAEGKFATAEQAYADILRKNPSRWSELDRE